jgi:DNA repair photolyase
MADRLPKELSKGFLTLNDGSERIHDEAGKPIRSDKTGKIKRRARKKIMPIDQIRLVLGTMTDPYQPAEGEHRITRTALQILTDEKQPQFRKVGIFTRSPMVLQDVDLIKKLPQARVHFTITPYPKEALRVIEPLSAHTKTRWEVVRKLKEAGLRVHVNVAPVLPGFSEPFIEEFITKLIDLGIDEYFVDPMQPYAQSFYAFRKACQCLPNVNWPKIEALMLNRQDYLDWKNDFFLAWNKVRNKLQHKLPQQLPIWCDHENKTWVDMRSLTQMNWNTYSEE